MGNIYLVLWGGHRYILSDIAVSNFYNWIIDRHIHYRMCTFLCDKCLFKFQTETTVLFRVDCQCIIWDIAKANTITTPKYLSKPVAFISREE